VLMSSHRDDRVLRAAVKVIPEFVYSESFAGACGVSSRACAFLELVWRACAWWSSSGS
jgi:hypothetical protein